METLNEKLFIIVPLCALLCNVFLFLTCLGARKNRVIIAFLELMCVFTMWCAGSFFMRMTIFPGPNFWYEVSILGIFLVPYFVYNFMYHFCEVRGTFVRRLLLAAWVVVAALNLNHVFVTNPHMEVRAGGEKFFSFGVSVWAVVPILLAVYTLYMAARIVVQAVRSDRVPANYFYPLLLGVLLMFAGTVISMLPQMVSLPIDTFACGLNAVCLYYALYKKRFITLTQITSNGSTYLVSAILTTIILASSYTSVELLYNTYFASYMEYKTIVIAVAFSLLTMLVYNLVKALTANLFVKRRELQDIELKKFSSEISQTLELDHILDIYVEYLKANVPEAQAYVCIRSSANGRFETAVSTDPVYDKSLVLPEDHPLLRWISNYDHGMYYSEFEHSRLYKSMWDSEKKLIGDLGIKFILPLVSEGKMAGLTLFASRNPGYTFNYNDINFTESMSAVLSIALRNAALYTDVQKEARCDPLTGLYNRGYFNECVQREFADVQRSTATLSIYNLDDFHLYNELYGTSSGDDMLRSFGTGLAALIGTRGIVSRYSAKEFAVFMPFGSVADAQQYAERMKAWLGRELARPHEEGLDDGLRRFLTFSVGICGYPAGAHTVDQLFGYAGMAVYNAKSNGKNRVVVYSAAEQQAEDAAALSAKQEIGKNFTSTIYALTAAIDAKDHYTFNHSVNVSNYAAALAKAIHLDSEHVEIIRQAGLLHDIGKIGIPDLILSKQSALTEDEYATMKQHVEGSIAMIRHLPSMDYVIPSVIGHHERYDGHGYPRQLAGEEIPIGARCLCIADSFDAMISRRSYKEPMNVEKALEEIRRNLGTQFDPHLGQVFIELVENGTIQVPSPGTAGPMPS